MCGCCFVWYISKILEWHNVVFLCTLPLFPSCSTKNWGSGISQKKVCVAIQKWKYYLKVRKKHSIMPWLLIACLVCFTFYVLSWITHTIRTSLPSLKKIGNSIIWGMANMRLYLLFNCDSCVIIRHWFSVPVFILGFSR